jgi:hypothetical protein
MSMLLIVVGGQSFADKTKAGGIADGWALYGLEDLKKGAPGLFPKHLLCLFLNEPPSGLGIGAPGASGEGEPKKGVKK